MTNEEIVQILSRLREHRSNAGMTVEALSLAIAKLSATCWTCQHGQGEILDSHPAIETVRCTLFGFVSEPNDYCSRHTPRPEGQ